MSEVSRCPACARKVSAAARCPHCGAKLRSPGKSRSDATRPDRKKRGQTDDRRRLIFWAAVGGGSALLLLVLALGVGLFFFFGGGGGIGESGPTKVVVEGPVPPLPPLGRPEDAPAPVVPPAPAPAPAPADDVPQAWAARPDPRSAPPEPIVDHVQPLSAGDPVLAAMDGPFVCYPGHHVTEPVVGGLKNEKGAEPTPVVDLRTGKVDGAFHARAPVFRNSRLSPDGQYVVGPDTAPDSPATTKDGFLLVWRRDEEKPATQLAASGIVLWADFIAPDRFAAASVDEKVQNLEGRVLKVSDQKLTLRIWNVANGKLTAEVPLEAGDVAVRRVEHWAMSVALGDGRMVQTEDPREDELLSAAGATDRPLPTLVYAAARELGCVSPGGRYVVLGGRNGLTVVSLGEGKVVGRLPLPKLRTRLDYQGFGFSDDGTTLYAHVNTKYRHETQVANSHDTYRLFAWSMADGRRTLDDSAGTEGGLAPLLPGPLPGTLLARWSLLDAESGLKLAELRFRVARWVGPGRALSWGPLYAAPADVQKEVDTRLGFTADRNGNTAWVRPFDEARAKALGGEALELYARRPPAAAADRARLAAVRPVAPEKWAVPAPAPAPAVPAADWLPAWPDAWGDSTAAIVHYSWIETEAKGKAPRGPGRLQVDWRRFDLRTGKELPPLNLWRWASRKDQRPWWRHASVAGLSPAGDRLALVDPSDASRVDVWDADGNRTVGFLPYGPKGSIAWVGWANGRLLTLGGGKLTGWELPACKAVFEVDGGYISPAHLPPGRAWVVAVAPAHADVIDCATGKLLGRCGADGLDDWKQTALSPDGRALLRVRHIPSPREKKTRGEAHIWDLTTCHKQEPLTFAVVPLDGNGPAAGDPQQGVVWAGKRQLLTVDRVCRLLDLDAGGLVCTYNFPQGYRPPPKEEWSERPTTERVSADPSGGVWLGGPQRVPDPKARTRREWRRIPVPNPAGAEDGLLAAADRTFPFHRSATVRVEVDLGARKRGQKLAERTAALLQREGYTLAPEGWTVRLTHAAVDGTWSLVGARTPIVVPAVELRWELVTPDGKQAWQGTTTHAWEHGAKSKYYIWKKQMGDGAADTLRLNYHFGNEEPRDAILAEILDSDALTLPDELPKVLPRALVHSGGAFHPVPRKAELPLPTP